jgi:hypothetical protein
LLHDGEGGGDVGVGLGDLDFVHLHLLGGGGEDVADGLELADLVDVHQLLPAHLLDLHQEHDEFERVDADVGEHFVGGERGSVALGVLGDDVEYGLLC